MGTSSAIQLPVDSNLYSRRLAVVKTADIIEAPLSLHEKLMVAKRYLGRNGVDHVDYRFNPRHSNNPEIYQLARAPYLVAIAVAARFDRERNPAFLRAQSIAAATGGAR